ncbi:MAG: endonuclease [Pseudoflavonifractor sp.]|nr:endonuclease [Alloprevotella sp.]MCM1117289.1 endonuclease [Pseudoflavonifractor sp.]
MTHQLISIRAIIAAIGLALTLQAAADIPSGYYDEAAGLATDRLKTALHAIVYPHTSVTYSKLPEYFKKTDVRPQTIFWWDMYSNIDVPINITFGTYMNREHSFPKSWWGGATNIPAYTDLFHLYPAEAKANQAKSNLPLGIVKGTPSFTNDVSKVGLGVESGGADKVFEPADEYKGDFARTYFYVVTAYQNLQWKNKWMVVDGDYPTLRPWAIEMLLKWHRDDPVSEKEVNRNEAVYAIQGNRNPFIDYPDLAEYIWGDKMGQTFMPGSAPEPGGEPTLVSPQPGVDIDFGRVAIGHTASRAILFHGHDLSGTLEMTITGEEAKAFDIEQTTLSAASVCTPSGVYLTLTYAPTEIAGHEARLIIQDGGLGGSISIPLRGEGAPEPQLAAPIALPAEMIDAHSYIARWEQPDEETNPIDWWNIYATSYRDNGETITRTILAESTSQEIEADSLARRETYRVTACALGCESSPSNEITVATGSIIPSIADATSPIDITTDGLSVSVRCPGASVMSVYDTLGRPMAIISGCNGSATITLPRPGVYIITTDTSSSPRRIIIRR